MGLPRRIDDFTMSGTSQATAVVSGVVALMLQVSPLLTPDEVKCRLMSGAHPAVNSNGTLAYTVFQQGAGLVNAHDADLQHRDRLRECGSERVRSTSPA